MNDNEIVEKLRETLNKLYDLKEEKLNELEEKKQELEEKILEVKRASIVNCLCAAPSFIYFYSAIRHLIEYMMGQELDYSILNILKGLAVLGINGLGLFWNLYKRNKMNVCNAEYQTELANLDNFDEIEDNLLKLLPEEEQQSLREQLEEIKNTTDQNYSRQTVVRTRKRTIIEEENIILQNEESFTR